VKPRIILVTDPAFADAIILRRVRAIAAALPAGAVCVQLRDKRRSDASLRLFAIELRRATLAAGAHLVVNGRPRLARDVGADGVHLGGEACSVAEAREAFGRPAWVSDAAHSDGDVRRALREGASAVLVSPIFATRSASPHHPPASAETAQTKMPARGLDTLRSARAIAGSRMAVFALGGVTGDRVRACLETGADGVAMIRAWLSGASCDSRESREWSVTRETIMRGFGTDGAHAKDLGPPTS
jgi:thiamine-phosphate pyrophosphorylase